ncbi:MAG UNVERIFIED_CONTAM: hypothetical protein LVR29_20830 [Microcystis novacekii LVE1205-3]
MSKKLWAEGNIIYEQQEPKFNLTGDKAIGTLEDNNIVVTSSSPIELSPRFIHVNREN